MTLTVNVSDQACGAEVRGIDLAQELSKSQIAELREHWVAHKVLSFPDQNMSDDDLERFTLYFGPFGDDPFIAPIPGRDHIIAVQRSAEDTGPVFAEAWHTDWSFQEKPPAGTCLYGITIPTSGGDTLFANQVKALAEMPDALRAKLDGKMAIHSAKRAYARDGLYGQKNARGSMDIRPADDANDTFVHPIIRTHPETGEDAIFGSVGYILGFEDMTEEDSMALLVELYQWQTRHDFQYRHKWSENMLVMWDNRSVLHMATGGYSGQARLLHRTTIGAA